MLPCCLQHLLATLGRESTVQVQKRLNENGKRIEFQGLRLVKKFPTSEVKEVSVLSFQWHTGHTTRQKTNLEKNNSPHWQFAKILFMTRRWTPLPPFLPPSTLHFRSFEASFRKPLRPGLRCSLSNLKGGEKGLKGRNAAGNPQSPFKPPLETPLKSTLKSISKPLEPLKSWTLQAPFDRSLGPSTP